MTDKTIKLNITINKENEENLYQSLDDNKFVTSWELPITKEIERLKSEVDKSLNRQNKDFLLELVNVLRHILPLDILNNQGNDTSRILQEMENIINDIK